MEFEELKNKALGHLSRRRHSKKELRDKLLKKTTNESEINEVILWAEEYGFLNDTEYARSYVLENQKKYGIKKIKFELKRRGIDEFLIEDLLFEMEKTDERKAISAHLRKKLPLPYDKRQLDKAIRFLISRGYSFSDIRAALSEYGFEEEFGDDEFEP